MSTAAIAPTNAFEQITQVQRQRLSASQDSVAIRQQSNEQNARQMQNDLVHREEIALDAQQGLNTMLGARVNTYA